MLEKVDLGWGDRRRMASQTIPVVRDVVTRRLQQLPRLAWNRLFIRLERHIAIAIDRASREILQGGIRKTKAQLRSRGG